MTSPEEVLAFWLDEIGEDGWYKGGEDLDALVRDRFQEAWKDAMEGSFGLWLTYPNGALAYVILMDQFPRNMFRDTAIAFASDGMARAVAKAAIARDWDQRVAGAPRQFLYMPLMHSENLTDQDRSVRCFCSRMAEGEDGNMIHARAHREIIRRFGRFPARNAAMGRKDTAAEAAWLAEGGYGAILRELQALAVA